MSQEASPSPVLIGITISDLDKEIEYLFSKLIDNTKLQGTTNSLDE